MNVNEIVLQGTLEPDGTLHLDAKPNLPPGRVTVVLRQETIASPVQEDWWQFMQGARKELEDAGSHFLSENEMQEHLEWLREEDRIDELLRESDDQPERG